MKLKVGILAPELQKNHLSYYKALVFLFLERGYTVNFYGNEWFKNELFNFWPHIKYDTKKMKESDLVFFRRIRKKAIVCDLIIVEQSYGTTLPYILGFSSIKTKLLYTVHNVNSWLAPSFSLSIRGFFTNLAHKYIVRKADGIVVVSANLKKFINSLKLIREKPTFYLPFSLPDIGKEIKNNVDASTITLVVPGTINPLRRDYFTLLTAFEKIIKQGIKNIHLVILGKPIYEFEATKKIIQKIETINKLQLGSISFWNDYVPQSEFSKYMFKADFLISNLEVFYPYSENYEIYGITKETGIPTLMYEYKKPCIIIGDYLVPNELKKHVITCSNISDLEDIFAKLSSGDIKESVYSQDYESTIEAMNMKIQMELDLLTEYISKDIALN